jgi:DNA-binding CsgD family transcriptional regulator
VTRFLVVDRTGLVRRSALPPEVDVVAAVEGPAKGLEAVTELAPDAVVVAAIVSPADAVSVLALLDGVDRRDGDALRVLERCRRGDAPLTPREREVLTLLARGYTSREIARELAISIRTVEMHRAAVVRKLGATSRAELVGGAERLGLR